MGTPNQYAISRVLGSKMRPVKDVRFGNFGLLETTAEALQARENQGPANSAAQFTYTEDRVVVRAFEDVRQGAAPDAILWNPKLARLFYKRCRELGLDAPDAFLGRRLINVRKNKQRYEKQGIKILPATVEEPHPSIVPQYAHVIEFALVKLRYRFGASIDDILLDPTLGKEFETLALGLAQHLSPEDLRLGALNIRKSRFLKKADQVSLAALNPAEIETACSAPILLSEVDETQIPSGPGLIELREDGRFLYIARNKDLRPLVERFHTGEAFKIMTNSFWSPQLDEITLQYIAGDEFANVGMAKWERKLIYDREPVFNWPMHKSAA